MPPDSPDNARCEADAPPPAVPRRIDSRDLLQGRREVFILHGEQAYRLRLTPAGGLILTK